jgi:aspartate/methionine/tyrosine aminotransferase
VQQIRLFRGLPVPWPLDEASGWRLQMETLPDLITNRTKAIVLVTPSNPTGAIFPKDDLLALAEAARKHGLLVLLDDPYSDFVYDTKHEFFNLAMEESLFDQMAYLFTFSKSHAMSGWRLGYMIVPDWLRQQVLKVHDATLICSPHISQVAGIAALSGGRAHVEKFRKILAERRELICERLDRVPHIFEYIKPQGAYYVFPRIVSNHENSFEFALRMLDEARVAVTPGSAFGPSGEHHVRLAFCVEEAEINAAFDRLEAWRPA